MKGVGFILICSIFLSCGNNKGVEQQEAEDRDFNYKNFAQRFEKAQHPYQLTDTGLLNNNDTTALRNAAFSALIPDSVKTKMLGKSTNVKYIPVARLGEAGSETYFIVKAVGNARKAAVLVAFDKDNSYGAALPFIIPDSDPDTKQTSTIDKSYSISRTVSRKGKDEITTEGKDVYAYNNAAKAFTLIMTDLLDDDIVELINPIDTFSKTHPFAGDYGTGKTNIVSIRDGRSANEINFYIHFEKDEGECIGELKGTAFFTSGKTAVYRQSGDACVLELQFTSAGVTLQEDEGCGLHRGLKCAFDGSYKKKKTTKKEANAKKSSKK